MVKCAYMYEVGSQCLFFSTSISMFLRISHSQATSWPCSSMPRKLTNGGCSGSRMKWLSPKPRSYFLPRLPGPDARVPHFHAVQGVTDGRASHHRDDVSRSQGRDDCVPAPIRRCSASA